ncbi:hypothetical protein BEWA_042000 [Theileria equi strain WA]|uniref:Uncharacterized protein n=1 Tax=Theileria equi strain WA TaxID=1537102 RepID=L1LFF1_THEEQ|nr:hypothetical protein BEWA_042000 [Theileria equi strain WA]EKX74162.1 hypothetical protein BEWA_042000 [Theileria equi strain WA]|eukprot:XP_004833614.1 hypothetical protein BEWA_042000 [Theileria equi strain WA]
MANEEVIIKLLQKPKGDPPAAKEYNGGGNGVTIKVKRTTHPPGSDFYRYEHRADNGGKFTLLEILDDNGKKINLPKVKNVPELPKNNVNSVSAYYWKHDNENPSKVLVVGVTTESDGTKYYAKSSGSPKWHRFNFSSPPKQSLPPEDLEKKLDDFNCKRNKAVTIDLYYVVSKDGIKNGKGTQYCCYNHYHRGAEKVTVTPVTIPCAQCGHNASSISYQKHSISDSRYSIAAIKYNEGGQYSGKKKSIKLTGLDFPTSDVESIYALYSNKTKEPVLIYLYSPKSNAKGWYHKGTQDSKPWTEIPNLKDITPEIINNCKEDNWSKLKGALESVGCGPNPGDTHPQLASHFTANIPKPFSALFPKLAAEAQLQAVSSDDESPGDNTTAIIGGAVGGTIGTGLIGVAAWKGPALLAQLIARL